MIKPPTAAIRQDVSGLTLHEAYSWTDILRIMRQRMVNGLREANVPGHIYFAASLTGTDSLSVTAIAGEDDGYSLSLVQRMRLTRKRWHGYRTDLDFYAAAEATE